MSIENDKSFDCPCKGNQNCFVCLGTGIIHSVEERKRMYGRFNEGLVEKNKNLSISRNDFINYSDKILPEKLGYIVTEATRTKKGAQIYLHNIPIRTSKGTVDYALGTSINELLKRLGQQTKDNLRHNRTYAISLVMQETIVPLVRKRYSTINELELINDIIDYFYIWFRNFKIRQALNES